MIDGGAPDRLIETGHCHAPDPLAALDPDTHRIRTFLCRIFPICPGSCGRTVCVRLRFPTCSRAIGYGRDDPGSGGDVRIVPAVLLHGTAHPVRIPLDLLKLWFIVDPLRSPDADRSFFDSGQKHVSRRFRRRRRTASGCKSVSHASSSPFSACSNLNSYNSALQIAAAILLPPFRPRLTIQGMPLSKIRSLA